MKLFVHLTAIWFCTFFITESSAYCTTGSDGLSFDCESEFKGESVSFSVKVKSCKDPPKIHVSLSVEALGINFDQDFDASQDIPIPGFSIGGLGGVFLKVQLDSQDDGSLNLKLQLSLKAIVEVFSVTVLDETVAETDCNSIFGWWSSQSVGVQAAVGVGGVVLFISFIACCYCCCCRRRQQTTFVMAPGVPAAGGTTVVSTSNNMMSMPAPSYYPPSNVPYEKQVNY